MPIENGESVPNGEGGDTEIDGAPPLPELTGYQRYLAARTRDEINAMERGTTPAQEFIRRVENEGGHVAASGGESFRFWRTRRLLGRIARSIKGGGVKLRPGVDYYTAQALPFKYYTISRTNQTLYFSKPCSSRGILGLF